MAFNPWLRIGEAIWMVAPDRRKKAPSTISSDRHAEHQKGLNSAPTQRIVRFANSMLRWWHQHNPIGAPGNMATSLRFGAGSCYLCSSSTKACNSPAYFTSPSATLAEAQQAKCAISREAALPNPDRGFSISVCGWGGLGIYLAKPPMRR